MKTTQLLNKHQDYHEAKIVPQIKRVYLVNHKTL
jgi:hypothetical protein